MFLMLLLYRRTYHACDYHQAHAQNQRRQLVVKLASYGRLDLL